MMTQPFRVLLLLAVGFAISGCGIFDSDDEDPPPPPPPSGQARVVHAVPDAPAVNVLLDGASVLTGLAFKESSGFGEINAGTFAVQVDAQIPGGTTPVIGPDNLTIAADTEYSVIAVGKASTMIEGIVIVNAESPVPARSARAQVVHGAPDAQQVAVYLTMPGADLTQEMPLGLLAFKEELGPELVAAGDYQIRVTAPNDPSMVLFDSGTITLPSSSDFLIVAVSNTGPGTKPVSLLLLDGNGATELLDKDTPTEFRVIHASFDAPAVDVIINNDDMNPLFEDVEYTKFSDYESVSPDTYNVKVTLANNSSAVAFQEDLALEAGVRYSLYAVDSLMAMTIRFYVLLDDNRPVTTEAKVRIVHLAPTAALVDIYVTAVGADITNLTPTFANVDYKDETGYTGLATGSYDVTVVPAGTKTAAIREPITVETGKVYTAVARDNQGGGTPLGLILLDDFN